MPIKIIIFTLMLCNFSQACKLGMNSNWSLSEPELEKVTKDVVIAKLITANGDPLKLVDLKFQVMEVIKGKKYKKDSFIYIKNVKKTNSTLVTYGKTCNFEFNYNINNEYQIYMDTLNPHSIELISSK